MKHTVAAGACLIAVAAAGQNPQQVPVFGTGITLVEVEVSVLDRNRRPVRGLTAADFTIREEGTPQQVETFAAIELPPPPATPWMREVSPDVRSNAPREGRLVAIVLDDAQMTLRMVQPTKEMARRLIAELSPGDLAAVIFTRDNAHSQEFTEDRARLLAAVETLHMGIAGAAMAPPPQPRGAMRYPYVPDSGDSSPGISQRNSATVLLKIAEAIGEVAKRRKAIFYLSPGVPVDPAGRSATATGLLASLSAVVREAQRWNVTIYPLDPGLEDLSGVLPTQRREFLKTVAEKSGGFVIGENDDLAAGVAQIFQETGTYYLLGYQSTRTEADGKFHPIEVKVARPDVTVRARGGYQAPRPVTASKSAPRASEVDEAMAAPLPKSDIQMQAFAAPFAGAGRSGPTLALIVGIRQPTPGDGARVQEHLELQLMAYAPEGKLRGSRRWTYGFGFQSAGPEAAYELVSQLDVPPGTYQLRIAARSQAQGKTGSVYYDVEVPDFSKRALTLSGLLLSADPAPVRVGADRLTIRLPLAPTSMRDFSPQAKVTAFARVYQRAKAPADVAAVLTLVNETGARVFRASESLAASQFGVDGSFDYLRELPMTGLEPGPYLLTIDLKRDEQTTTGRSVRFTVVPQ